MNIFSSQKNAGVMRVYNILQPGMRAPDFLLNDIYDRPVSLEQYSGRPLIIVFMRHLGCLLTRLHLAQLRQQYGKIQYLGGEVLIISFENREAMRRLVDGHKFPFVVLLDPAKEVYRQYGMVYRKQGRTGNLSTAFAYLRLRLSGYPKQVAGSDTRQMGGDVIIDRQGEISFIHRSEYPHDLPAVESILKVITEMKG